MQKITDHERTKLFAKLTDIRYPPQQRAQNAGRLARLIMRRHGVSVATHEIRMPDGEIVEKHHSN